MALVLSLAAALTYGAADFAGGLVTKRNDVLRVVFLSQIVGFVPLLFVSQMRIGSSVTREALVWGAVAGICGACGVTSLYRGLSIGQMNVVAPVTAIGAAMLPALFGLLMGERPGPTALIGILIALFATGLISTQASSSESPKPIRPDGILEAILAGASFGGFFILMERASSASIVWPLVAARTTSLVVIALAVGALGISLRPAPGTFFGIGLAGILDVFGNIFYVLSTQFGLLSLVAVVTSMYPATTVVMARLILNERLVQVQFAGLGLAAVGLTLMTV